MIGLGEVLRRAREQQGLTYEEVEAETRIRKKYLVALEEEDFKNLPAAVYVKGFIRNYANLLELNPDEVLKLYPQEEGPATMEIPPQLERPAQGYGVWLSVAVVLAIMLAMGTYFFNQGSVGAPSAPTVIISIPSISPTPAFSPTPSPEPYSNKVEVVARAIERTWLSITIDGQQSFNGFMEIGQTETWTGTDRVSMRVGNAGGIIVTHNGNLQGTLGRPGQVMTIEWTTSGTVIPGGTPTPLAGITPQASPRASPTVRR